MMKLILIDDVDGLGRRGDVVDVADGYGRNYLLPNGKAAKATEGALRHAERDRRIREETDRRAREEAEQVAQQLVGTRVVIAAQAGDEGRLFGSVGPTDIVEGVRKFTGVELDRKAVALRTPIKAIGLYDVRIKLHEAVEFPLTIDVIPA